MPQTPDLTKYLDAGAEFVALVPQAGARTRAQELVQQGQLAQNQVQGFVDGLVEGSRRRTDLLMDGVRQEIQRQVQAVGIATKDDLVKLEAKLAQADEGGREESAAKSATKNAKKAAKKKSDTAKQSTEAASARRRREEDSEEDGEVGLGRRRVVLGPLRRRLDAELVRRGLVPSRARAVEVIDAGLVTVGGAPARVGVASGRGGRGGGGRRPTGPVRVARRREARRRARRAGPSTSGAGGSLDAGASTGGFTDCLRQRGADPVVAVDVGHGQLAWSLRNDPGVVVMERTNLRHLDALPGGPAELAVADLSFISLRTVAPALVRLTVPTATYVLLVKPQFEAGRRRIGSGGIVRDPAVHRAVLAEVVDGLGEQGIVVTDVLRSPLTGADGNVEFLARAGRSGATVAGRRARRGRRGGA